MWICIGLVILGLAIDNGITNIANVLLLTKLIERGMTPEEVNDYLESLEEEK